MDALGLLYTYRCRVKSSEPSILQSIIIPKDPKVSIYFFAKLPTDPVVPPVGKSYPLLDIT